MQCNHRLPILKLTALQSACYSPTTYNHNITSKGLSMDLSQVSEGTFNLRSLCLKLNVKNDYPKYWICFIISWDFIRISFLTIEFKQIYLHCSIYWGLMPEVRFGFCFWFTYLLYNVQSMKAWCLKSLSKCSFFCVLLVVFVNRRTLQYVEFRVS